MTAEELIALIKDISDQDEMETYYREEMNAKVIREHTVGPNGFNGYKVGETMCGICDGNFTSVELKEGDILNRDYDWLTQLEFDVLVERIAVFKMTRKIVFERPVSIGMTRGLLPGVEGYILEHSINSHDQYWDALKTFDRLVDAIQRGFLQRMPETSLYLLKLKREIVSFEERHPKLIEIVWTQE